MHFSIDVRDLREFPAIDVRAYDEEAAIPLADHVPASRSTESWFYEIATAGWTVLAAGDAVRKAEGPWLRMALLTR